MTALFNEAPTWWWTQDGEGGLPAHFWPVWPLLLLGEACYKRSIARRNASYDRRQQAGELFRPAVPTISVGNITVGGSGKTPVAIWLAGLLHERGLKPAIIARGYGAASGELNDEMLLAARKCPYAAVLANPDRARAIGEATSAHGANAVVLDDAFQHRKVRRDLDIVLVDATRGFGNGHMLPAGPLREPVESLRRADLVLLTRAEQVLPAHVEALVERIAQHGRKDLPIGRISFQPAGLTDLQFAPADLPEGPGGAFAGIGNFWAFFHTCRQHGLDVVAHMPLTDHVHYDKALCDRISQWAHTSKVRWLVTTEKDAVKLSQISWDWPVPVYVLAIQAVPDEQTRTMVEASVDSALGRKG